MDSTQFDFSFAPGTTEQQIVGFEMAGEIWSQYLTDDVSLAIHVEVLDLPSNAVGIAYPALVDNQSYENFFNKAENDILSGEDAVAFNNLQKGEEGETYSTMIDGKINHNNEKIMLTRANSKALGINTNRSYGDLDGYIQIDSNVSWSYDFLRNNVPSSQEYDFLSVALHELGHTLGFISGIDGNLLSTSLDMFRYSQKSERKGVTDFSLGANAYFSIDGGKTKIADFSTGEDGDNYQASHWNDKGSVGIMNPDINRGDIVNISSTDLLAMDVIGWDINSDATIDLASLFQQAQANVVTANVVDRSSDVEKMKADSEAYYWWWQDNSGGNGWWQEGTANAPEFESKEADSSDSPTIYVTFLQDISSVTKEHILSENHDLNDKDISGAERSLLDSEAIQDINLANIEAKELSSSGELLPEDLVSDLLKNKLEDELPLAI